MAKSSKTRTEKADIKTSDSDLVNEVVDSEAVAEETPEADDRGFDALTDVSSDDRPDNESEVSDNDNLGIEEVDDNPEPDLSTHSEANAPTTTESSSGFMPLALGGIVAGAIGYGVATFFPMFGNTDDVATQLAAQSSKIEALENVVSQLPSADISELEAQIGALNDDVASQIGGVADSLSSQLATLDGRLSDLERQPNADGTLSDTALAAYRQELEDLRSELDAQQESVMSAASQAEADLAAARAEAETLEQEALAAATAAAARAALNRVATAVETGAPFATALSDLDATDLPSALTSSAEAGVATTAQLVQDFPAAARAALATARAEGVSEDAGGFGGFLRSQFDVRSTTPQEGSGPDAILSRAEAAIKEGRVADALAELEALPEVARAELTDWTARATERADVLNAIASLSETYN